MNKFIIFSAPRTGSTMLSSSLNYHSKLKVMNEIFHEYYPSMVTWRIHNLGPIYSNIHNFAINTQLLDTIFQKIDGFKIISVNEILRNNASNLYRFIDYVESHDIVAIILKRKDVINSLISLQLSETTKIYQNSDFQTHQENIRITVNLQDFERRIQKMEEFYKTVDALGNKIEVYYDQLIENWTEETNKIFDKIDVEREEVKMSLGKLTNQDYKEYVENYGDVFRHFQHTKWGVKKILI